MPKFSITIPAYKKRYLAEAVNSVLAQTYLDYELIIVDDNSPENLLSVVEEFKDNRIRYYRNNKNCGAINVVDNWNICLQYCTGNYVICMGDDDRLLPCCLEEYNKLIGKYPDLDVYHAWTQIIDENGNVSRVLQPRPEWESFFAMTYYRWKNRRQFIGDFCYNTEHLRNNGGYYKLPLAWMSDDITAGRAAYEKGVANTLVPCFEYRISRITISSSTDMTEIKLHSSMAGHKWYKDILETVNSPVLSDVDKWYYTQLLNIIEHTRQRRMLGEIMNDIRSHLFNSFMWLKRCPEFEINRKLFFKSLIKYLL